MIKQTRQQRRSVLINQKKSEYMQSLIDMYNIQYRREGTYTTREVGTFNPVFGGVSMHMPNNKAYKNSLNRFLWNTVREIRTARAFLRWTMYHEYMLQWYEQNPLWEIYKDYTTTKAVITTPKVEKMNLVQSHRLEVHRKGFRTHRDYVSVSTSQRKSERKYYKKYINKNI